MLKGLDDAVDLSPENSSDNVDNIPGICRLYFKGLVNEDSLAGFGVAVLGQKDDLLFQMKGPIHHDSTITALEADVTALKRGLDEAVKLGIKHISIYSDHYPTFELITGKSVSEENRTALLMIDVGLIREHFTSSFPIFVHYNTIKYAYELARETLTSEVRILVNPPNQAKATRKATCVICMEDNIDAYKMFVVDKCYHRFCSECTRRHIEVRLLERRAIKCLHDLCKTQLELKDCVDLLTPKLRNIWEERIKEDLIPVTESISSEAGILVNPPHQAKATRKETCVICMEDNIDSSKMYVVDRCYHRLCSECMKLHLMVMLLDRSVMKCPHFRCKTRLKFKDCVDLLTPKLRNIWEERINEDSIPVTEKIYCPNLKCSALMSKTKLTLETNETGVTRSCFKCGQLFCINCKVLWQDNLSCDDYKMLHPYPTENDTHLKALANQRMWRQCVKCQHMIELSHGCVLVKCRCGHEFCYQCGADAGKCNHGHGFVPRLQSSPLNPLPLQIPQQGLPPPTRHKWLVSSLCLLVIIVCLVIIIVKGLG